MGAGRPLPRPARSRPREQQEPNLPGFKGPPFAPPSTPPHTHTYTHARQHLPGAPAESDEGPVPDAERERRVALFTPTLERLVALIRGRVRFHEAFDSWHRDERQDFKRAR